MVVFVAGGKEARQEVRVMTGAAEAKGEVETEAEAEEVWVAERRDEAEWEEVRVTVWVPETVTTGAEDESLLVDDEDLLSRSFTRRTVTPAMRKMIIRMRPIWKEESRRNESQRREQKSSR